MSEKWLALKPIGIHERVGLDLTDIGVTPLQMLLYASLHCFFVNYYYKGDANMQFAARILCCYVI
jgi:hypothetical protein